MRIEFKQTLFYKLQPILGIILVLVPFCYLLIHRRKDPGYDWVALVIIFCFVIYAIGKLLYGLYNRSRDPIEVNITDEVITAAYRNEKTTEIAWNDIAYIKIHKDFLNSGFESIEIMSKENTHRIICNNLLKGYALFKEVVIEKDPGRVKRGVKGND